MSTVAVHSCFVGAGHSTMSDLPKCYRGFLKHNVNILKTEFYLFLFLFVLDYNEL